MCGIAGLSLATDQPMAREVVGEMLQRITHRGPDSSGHFTSPNRRNGAIHLGFRRLAIQDLDPRANQPMLSASGRTAIVFNGEVYNAVELADRYLDGHALRTTGDTEVLLEAIERHGIQVVSQFNGMFGLAVLDIESGRLQLARDRMGKKPIYLYQREGVVAFGSELRTLKPFGLQLDASMAGLFLHFGYVPSPHTFFRHTTQVAPGEIVEVEAGRVVAQRQFHRFTDLGWAETADVDIDELDALLHDSVQRRKLSDVPLGAFLSGGVDSALVAANLRKREIEDQSLEPTPTFTVAFADQAHNEADAAAETATVLGLPNEVISIDEQDLSNLAVDFMDCYEQPYADTSGLVTMLLCRAVKQHVTVALSGDGGDEFFGGYARYTWFRKALLAQKFPSLFRQFAAMGIQRLDGRRGGRLARWFNAKDPASLYAEILRNWNATAQDSILEPANTAIQPVDIIRGVFDNVDADPLSQAACFDATYYIPDDLQVKLDRASMQVALEVRCPLLDYRFAEKGASLTTARKYRGGMKAVLKQCLGKHVPARVLQRPKHGFNVPLARWLRGPMRQLVEDTLQQQTTREAGWLNSRTAVQVWQDFQDGQSQHAHSVWMIFNLAHHLQNTSTDAQFTSLVELASRRKAA